MTHISKNKIGNHKFFTKSKVWHKNIKKKIRDLVGNELAKNNSIREYEKLLH